MPIDCLEEGKSFCMKQINPYDDELFFGIPYEYDENWYACYLCMELGLGRAYVFNPPVGMPLDIPLKRRVLHLRERR